MQLRGWQHYLIAVVAGIAASILVSRALGLPRHAPGFGPLLARYGTSFVVYMAVLYLPGLWKRYRRGDA